MIGIITETDVPIPVRDGLKLSANAWRPDLPGRFPVIMAQVAHRALKLQALDAGRACRGAEELRCAHIVSSWLRSPRRRR
jgi:predicted acyl esterase